eukprot:GHVT01093859.1.p1 GENE.GHVT01093859.1~~GHVT01093859.1.p1  ORF type:complete len:108 (+),score=2.98 GHVT01093859.1:2074-2397(+)
MKLHLVKVQIGAPLVGHQECHDPRSRLPAVGHPEHLRRRLAVEMPKLPRVGGALDIPDTKGKERHMRSPVATHIPKKTHPVVLMIKTRVGIRLLAAGSSLQKRQSEW